MEEPDFCFEIGAVQLPVAQQHRPSTEIVLCFFCDSKTNINMAAHRVSLYSDLALAGRSVSPFGAKIATKGSFLAAFKFDTESIIDLHLGSRVNWKSLEGE